ncbi:Gamma-D-glutamyl-L-lysine dipeptidyl-peptidase [Methylorubrum aminovorans]|uniref:Gamma-D-glutamyl-L-lysine dipeptidyl-peptidase n=1 Tax=Methylorubrum aminovorans TaxID=269069 RepID=A0ABQ4UF25_9HYPH|nr:NlpC/P60 family protein [Methylorubrum aminovorans]GJE65598.1 Gamma-D-glutamyl-L-lysine dipeptidyl-peptidase [Methylorubrum aminovorans]GMA77219.1 peptidase P60 [Methylorubrum aminovorans]
MPDTSDPRLTPARSDLADIRLRGVVAAERYVAGAPARVAVPSAPLRRAPRLEAGLDTEAVMGDAVSVFEIRDGFAWVQIHRDGYVGYLPESALGAVDPEPTHRVAALRTFVYPAPDLKRPHVAHLSLGATFAAQAQEGEYWQLAGGGFVFAGHAVPFGTAEADYAATAERLVGTPYLWGGRTSLGLDCSGLVQLCLEHAGRACPRDADQQERALGDSLPPGLDGLRRGDLVFWKGHVGLMLDAERLIHANGHHMAVAVEPLREAVARIAVKSFGTVTSIRRLDFSA